MPHKTETVQHRVRRYAKQLPFTYAGLQRELTQNDGNFDCVATLRVVRGRVRIIIRCRRDIAECWAMAVLFNDQRVDGIDWERTVEDHRGKKHNCNGWHRHIWSVATKIR